MSSLCMVGPRAKYFDLVAQQNDAEILIQKIRRQEQIKIGLRILAGIAAFALFYWVIATGLDKPQAVHTSYDNIEMM